MIDFDERERAIDATLRAGSLRLREGAARAAVPAFRARRRPRRGWLIAAATAIVVIVGLVAIGTNRNDRSLGNDPSRLRWLVTVPPAGLSAVSAFDAESVPETDTARPLINLYASDDAPAGPILLLQASKGIADLGVSPGEIKGLTNYQETTIAGHRAVFADGSGKRVLYVEVDGHWVFMEARSIDDPTLRGLGQAVVRNQDGSAEIPAQALVDGLRLVAPASSPFDPMILPRPGGGVAASAYSAPGGQREISLAVGFPRLAVKAFDALSYELKSVKIGAASGFMGSVDVNSVPPTTSRMVYWERDGLAFRLSGHGVSEAEMIAAAVSARPASSAAWDALVRRVDPAAAAAPAGTTPAGTTPTGATPSDAAPADTVPPFTGEAHDVAIDVSVATPSSHEQVWSGTLPTGEAWKVQLTRVYDSISFWPEVNGASQGSSSGSTVRRPAGQEFACCMPLNVITADPKAAAMRVTSSNGGRYTIPLHDLPGGGGLRIALLALPDGGGPAHADLIDADGNVLRSM